MNRFRALLLVAVAVGLAAPVARAATIDVTTPDDIVADNDELCSIREAINATIRADVIRERESGRQQIVSEQEVLEGQLPRLKVRPEETFSRVALLNMVENLHAEVSKHEVPDAILLADIQSIIDYLNPAPPAPMPPNPNLVWVEIVIALQDRALERIDGTADEDGDEDAAIEGELPRLKRENEVDGCIDGSAFDVISLGEDTYHLTAGTLLIDRRTTIRGSGEKTIIQPAAGIRPFTLLESSSLDLSKLEIFGADLAGTGALGCDVSSMDDDGGALLVNGTLTVQDVILRGNRACDGGAVYVQAKGSINFTTVSLLGNVALGNGGGIASVAGVMLADVRFGSAVAGTGNRAGGNGGAIHMSPVAEAVSLEMDRGSIINNEAANSGSGLHVGGLNTSVTLVNVTIAQNEAGVRAAINVETTGTAVARLLMNNVTLVDNHAATAATGGLHVQTIGGTGVMITNSLLADNENQDCDFTNVSPVVNHDYFSRNYYGQAGGCPGGIDGSVPAPSIMELRNFRLPAGRAAIGYLVRPPGADGDYYLPIYPADEAEDRLVNRGASTQDANRCADRDQRDKERASFADIDCDIGAIEYQIGRRLDDIIERVVGQVSCLDVALNDIGDALYEPGTLRVLDVERANIGARAVVLLRDPDGSGPLVDQVDQCPNVAEINAADPARERDVILFTPPPGFQGETIVTYALKWKTPDPVSTGEVSGYARVVTESRGGIKSASLGGTSVLFLFSLLAIACRRLAMRGPLLAALALFLALPVQANENIIYVNSGRDSFDASSLAPKPVAGDGLCTLREALATARNDQANLTGGDCVNGNEGPDVIEFIRNDDDAGYVVTDADADNLPDIDPETGDRIVRLIILVEPPLTAYGGVTLRCPEPTVVTDEVTSNQTTTRYECVVRASGVRYPPSTEPRKFSLINSEGSISLVRMIFENGDAGSGNGGAINSRGGVYISDSVFRNNQGRTGGAIFLRGVRADLAINNSTFEGNRSTGASASDGGGAIATTADDEHRIQIESSTFVGNQSVASAAALALKTLRPVAIANSTFSGNSSTAGAGAIDVSGAVGSITLRNLTIVGNESAPGKAAIEAPGRSLVLANSIVAANYEAGGVLPRVDANCGAGLFNVAFNVIGETTATCPAGTGGGTYPPTQVYDPSGVGAWLGPLEEAGGSTRMHLPDRDATAGIIIDAGYNLDVDGNLVLPLETTSPKCANVDQRGVSRESGGRCDIGAYEYLRVTATSDSGSNIGRYDRTVLIDLLVNDLFAPEDPEQAKSDCSLVPVVEGGEVRLVDASGDPCLVVYLGSSGVPATDIEFFRKSRTIRGEDVWKDASGTVRPEMERWLSTESPYVMHFLNTAGVSIDEEAPKVLQYRIYTKGGVASDTASISLSVENVPPFAYPDVMRAAVGQTVVIDVLANDKEYDGSLDPASVTISGANCHEVVDIVDFDGDGDVAEKYWQCEFGRATIDPLTGRITWIPTNKFNPFTETFSYTVTDQEAEPKESTTTVTITMTLAKANGGGMLGEDDLSDILGIDFLGGLGTGTLCLAGLLALRRLRQV